MSPAQPSSPNAPVPDAPRERLQKVMAAAGVGSRRACEELIVEGRVEVDRQVVSKLGAVVDAQAAEIRVDGVVIAARRKVYYLVNKPPGVLSTNRDPAGRPRVIDLLPSSRERLFTVGRLDMASEGLMIVTNDGELADRLTHPRYGVEKTYHVLVAGIPTRESLKKLTDGVHLAEGFARAVRVKVRTRLKQSAVLEIVLKEGRNREIRRLLARVGNKVLRLKRVAIADVRVGNLPPGEFRRLAADELRSLRSASRRPAGSGRDRKESLAAAGAAKPSDARSRTTRSRGVKTHRAKTAATKREGAKTRTTKTRKRRPAEPKGRRR